MAYRLNKAQLREELESLGETAPASWSKLELRTRLMEIRVEEGIDTTHGKPRSRLEVMMKDLNVASKKKELLVRFVQDKLDLTVSSNDSVTTLQSKAVKRIYEVVAPAPTDPLGFGKHAELTYSEVMLNIPDYCTWIKDTATQNPVGSDYRLRRFATWLNENQSAGTGSSWTMTRTPMGRARGAPSVPKAPTPSPGRSSKEDQKKMDAMMETIQALKQEIAEMKGEPVRKTAKGYEAENEASEGAGETSSAHSFQLVKK